MREEPASAARSEAQARLHLRRNYAAMLVHGLLGQTGMRLVNAPTFIPDYVSSLAGFDAAAGIARGLQYLGMFLSPVLGATWTEHRRRVLPVGIAVGAAMRIQILGIALAALFLPDRPALLLAWGFLALFGFFLGIQGVVFNVLVSKVIPVRTRGLLMGLRNALSGVSATAVALYAGGALIAANALGSGYGATFLVAFGLTSCGLLMLLFVREPEAPQVRQASRVGQRLRELPALLRSDRGFTRYFVARALATMGRMAMPFYILFARDRLVLSGENIGVLTAAFVAANSAASLAAGILADRRGFRVVFLVSLSIWVIAVLMLMRADGLPVFVGVFAALGAGLGGFQLSAQQLVLEFGSRRNLPMRIAVANSASELVAAFGALLGGLLSFAVSHVVIFQVAIAFQVAALALVVFGVEEPRRRR